MTKNRKEKNSPKEEKRLDKYGTHWHIQFNSDKKIYNYQREERKKCQTICEKKNTQRESHVKADLNSQLKQI